MERTTIYKAIGAGTTVVLAISTIMGGLLVEGLTIGIVIVVVGLLVISIRLWLANRQRTQIPIQLSLEGFAYLKPSWLSVEEESAFTDLAKAGLLLLVFDRSKTGCWGKTYMYRRAVSNSGLPLACGSLTGTPLSLNAFASLVQQIDFFLREWAYSQLSATLAKILTKDGTYLHGKGVSTMGIVPKFEPLRHASGGCLINLLFRNPDNRDLNTLKILCTSPLDQMAWDKAIVARTLLQATQLHSIPHKLQNLTLNRYKEIMEELILDGENATTAARIWANPYEYGIDANNQWATVWAVLPSLSLPILSQSLRDRLESVLCRFQLAQSQSVQNTQRLLPSKIDPSGVGTGIHIFGTTMSVVAWRTLELYGKNKEQAGSYSHSLIKSILLTLPQVIKSPSEHDPSEPLALEGNIAWAGVCLSAASVGIRITVDDCRRIILLSKKFEDIETAELSEEQIFQKVSELLVQAGLFTSKTTTSVAQSCSNILMLPRRASLIK